MARRPCSVSSASAPSTSAVASWRLSQCSSSPWIWWRSASSDEHTASSAIRSASISMVAGVGESEMIPAGRGPNIGPLGWELLQRELLHRFTAKGRSARRSSEQNADRRTGTPIRAALREPDDAIELQPPSVAELLADIRRQVALHEAARGCRLAVGIEEPRGRRRQDPVGAARRREPDVVEREGRRAAEYAVADGAE